MSLSPQQLFDLWAPSRSPWSPWVKPAIFATMRGVAEPADVAALAVLDVGWAPRAAERIALVIELPGVTAVRVGLALAAVGYRPVPLFNTTCDEPAVRPAQPIADELATAPTVPALGTLPDDAPPAFLLDSDRMREDRRPDPDVYDNRWMIFPQDFPSATFLKQCGITGVLLVSGGAAPAADLVHVLRRWQEARLPLTGTTPAAQARPAPLSVPRPRGFGSIWHRALVLLRLRRSYAGGFGGRILDPGRGSARGFS
jgi:hypothetical protein